MKKNFYLIACTTCIVACLLAFTSCSSDDSGTSTSYKYLIGVTAERHYTKAELARMLSAYVNALHIPENTIEALISDIDAASITYKTEGVDGKIITASGIVIYPTDTKKYSRLLSIQHGTLDLEEAPSKHLFYYELAPVLMRHVTVMADYIGYGASQTTDRQHPYLHIKYTGTTCADMIEAAREYLKSKGIVEEDDKIDLMGYSQGGNSTIATLLEFANRGESNRIHAAYAGGGAYDLVSTMQYFMSNTNNYPRSGYIPYIIRGISYGDGIALNDKNIYAKRVIDNNLTSIFSTKPLSEWHALLGSDLTQVINSDFFAYPSFNSNADIQKLFDGLKRNSLVYKTLPDNVPVFLYHSKTDDFVPYVNATSAKAKWPSASLIDLNMDTHYMGGVEFMLRYMGLWDFVKGSLNSAQAETKLKAIVAHSQE